MQKLNQISGKGNRKPFTRLLSSPWLIAVIAVFLGGLIWYELITEIDRRFIEEARFEFNSNLQQDAAVLSQYINEVENGMDIWYQLNDDAENPDPYELIKEDWKVYSKDFIVDYPAIISLGSITPDGISFSAPENSPLEQDLALVIQKSVLPAGWQINTYKQSDQSTILILNRKNSFRNEKHVLFILIEPGKWLAEVSGLQNEFVLININDLPLTESDQIGNLEYAQAEIVLPGTSLFLRRYFPSDFEKNIRSENYLIKWITGLWVVLLGVLFYRLIKQQQTLSKYAQNKTRELQLEFSERLQIEEDLAKNRAAFLEASNRAHIGYWECDVLTDEFYWSDELYRITDETPAMFIPTLESIQALILPEDLYTFETKRYVSIREHKPINFEVRIRKSNGDIADLWITSNPYLDSQGNLKILWGLAQDISDLKKNERRLQKTNKMLQMISQCDQLLVRIDNDTVLIKEICRAIVNSGLFYLAWIGKKNTIDGEIGERIAAYSLNKYPVENSDLVLSPAMHEVAREAVQNHRPSVGQFGSTKASGKRNVKNPIKDKCHTFIVIPLQISETENFLLYMYSGENLNVDDEERKLFTSFGLDVANGIRSIRNHQDYLRTQEALQQSEQKLNQVYQTSPDAIVISSLTEGKFIDVNPGFCVLTGYSRNEVIGNASQEINLWVDNSTRLEMVDQLQKTGEVINLETAFKRKDNEIVTCLLSARLININGENCILSITRDISDRIATTKALIASEERLRIITESMAEAVFLTDLELTPIYISPAAYKQRGYNASELMEIPFNKQLSADSTNLLHSTIADISKRTQEQSAEIQLTTPIEVQMYHKDGSLEWYELTVTLLMNVDGHPKQLLFVGRNISERKEMQEALRASEERWHYALEGSGDGVWDWHIQSGQVYFSHRWKEMLGYQDDEIIHVLDSWKNLVHPDDLNKVLEVVQGHLDGKTDSYRTEHRMLCKDGRYIWILDRGKIISYNDHGTPIRMVGTHTDLSEQKNLLFALEQSEQQFRLLAEKSSDMIARINVSGELLYISPACERITGYQPSELENKYLLDIIHPDDRSLVNYILSQVENSEELYPIQYRMVKNDGSLVWIESMTAMIRSVDNPAELEIQVTSRDISERVNSERALRESEEKLRALISQSSDGILITDDAGRIIEWSRGQEQISGLRSDEVLGKYIWDVEYSILPVEERNEDGLIKLKERTIELLSQGSHPKINQISEHTIQSPAGRQLIVQTTYFPIRTPSAYMTGAISRDITSLKNVEKALKQSEEQLRYVTDNMLDIVSYTDAEWRIQYISPSVKPTLGYKPEDLLNQSIISYIHPEDVQLVKDNIYRCIHRAENRVQISYRSLNSIGVYIWLESLVNITYDPSGKFLGAVFGTRDISDRKYSSDALRESEARYRTLARNFPNGAVMLFDRDLRYTVADGAGLAQVGLNREILEGQTIFDIFTDDTVRILEPYYRAVLNGRTEVFELEMGEKTLQFYAVPIRDELGDITSGMVMTQDITDRKIALEALHEHAKFLLRLNEITRVALETEDSSSYIQNITDLMASMFAADNCMLTTWDPSNEQTIPAASSGSLRDVYQSMEVPPRGLTLTQSVLSKGEPLIVPDLHHSEFIDRKLAKQFSLKSVLALPLIGGGQKLGAMLLGYNSDHEFTESEVIEASQVADQVALGLFKQKLLDEIQKSNLELENRVAERTADLEAKNKELETFTYSVSHDLKAPLRGIEGYSKLLVEDHAGQLDEEGLAFLNTIRSATNQMSRLIEDLLSYSRLERRSLTNDKVNIADMVTNLLNERKRDIQQRKIRVVNQIPDEWVVFDQQAMNQALRNLIDNAIKFLRPESSPEIVFSLTSKSDVDILSISDNGIGFEMKFNEKIFDIFQRLHLADDYPGTGIGLALVKKAMQRMGGRVWAESEPGKGSTFYLEFPRGN